MSYRNKLSALISQLLVHEGLKKYGGNIAWRISERLIRLLLGLLVGVFLARYLEPTQFGLFSYAQSFVLIFGALSGFGIETLTIRALVDKPEESSKILGTAWVIKLIGGLLSIILIGVSAYLVNNDPYVNLLILIIASANILYSFGVIDFFYQSIVKSKYVAVVNIIAIICSSLIKFYLIMSGASLIAFAYMTIFDIIIPVLGLIYCYGRISKQSIARWQFDYQFAKELVVSSFPLLISGLMIVIYNRTDQLMIRHMLGDTELGYYSVAVRLSELWGFLPEIICGSVFPAIVNAKAISEQLYLKRLSYLYSFMIWLSIAVIVFVTVLAEPIIHFTFGDNYLSSKSSLIVLIWANFFVFFSTVYSKYMIVENQQKILIFYDVSAVFLNIVLNLILIPKYGIVGASIATMLSVPMAFLLMCFYKKHTPALNLFGKSLLFRW